MYKRNDTQACAIAKSLIQLGEKLDNVKMKCYGRDLRATVWVSMDKKEKFEEAKQIFEEVKAVNKSWHSKGYYKTLLDKLKKLQ